MLMRDQLVAGIKSAQTDPTIAKRSPLVRVVLMNNRFAMTAWRSGEQRARE
jgi:hypothetical protein